MQIKKAAEHGLFQEIQEFSVQACISSIKNDFCNIFEKHIIVKKYLVR